MTPPIDLGAKINNRPSQEPHIVNPTIPILKVLLQQGICIATGVIVLAYMSGVALAQFKG